MSEGKKMIGIVDCASFFASCERIFHPELEGKAVVVLSNNDGCVVAMSQEAKQRNIPMGIPWFKLSAWAATNGVVAKSSNYELYGSISARIMERIGRYTPWQEIYSIDESFIELRGSPEEMIETARKIRADVYRATGIPVRIGIAPTKTLAKVAIMGAKQNLSLDGVCYLGQYSNERIDEILAAIHVTELWGVGRKYGRKLAALSIHSAKDLRDADARYIRKRFSVVLQRTVYELRGIRCIELEESRQYKDQLIFSRSFSRPVTTAEEMRQVLSIYAQKVGSRLRKEGQVARTISAWAMTGYHNEAGWHSAHVSTTIDTHTNEPIRIAKAAGALLSKIQHGTRYARAGIVLTDLMPETQLSPLELFIPEFEGRGIGATLDRINERLGVHMVGVGRGGLKDPPVWNMRRNMLSKRGTTQWEELCTVKAL